MSSKVTSSIQMDDVTFLYLRAEKPTLRNVNLKVKEGSFTILFGDTGAGKSTLIMTLNGIIPRSVPGKMEGRIVVAGLDTRKCEISELARHIGIMFGDPSSQIIAPTVEEDVAFGPANLGIPTDEIWERVQHTLEAVGLKGFERRNPHTLSGGEQQRLAMAGIIAMRPEIMVLDEPLCLLDPLGKSQVLSVIRDLSKKYDITLMVSESGMDIEHVAPLADHIAFISQGEKIAEGSPREVFSNDELVKKTRMKLPQVTELAITLGLSKDEPLPITVEDGREYLVKLFRRRGIKKARSLRKATPAEHERRKRKEAVRVRKLHHVYPGATPVEALRGLSLDIYEGETLAIIGQNGSGKTTLSYHLVGLLKPTNPDAEIVVDGLDVTQEPQTEIIKHINYVFQNPSNQLFSEKVIDELVYGPMNLGLSRDEAESKASEMLKLFEIEQYRDAYIEPLPINLKTFVAIASVLVMDPKILIIDEPTTGLDWLSSKKVMEIVKKVLEGRTSIIITHDMKLVAEYADRVMVMKEGLPLMTGTTREVFSQPDKLKQAYIEPPQITKLGQICEDLGLPPDLLTVEEAYETITKTPRPRREQKSQSS